MNVGNFKFAFVFLVLLAFFVPAQQALGDDLPAGKVVWWGEDFFWKKVYSTNTNGVLEGNDGILTDVVAVVNVGSGAFTLKEDGTACIYEFDRADLSPNVSNIVSIAFEGRTWALNRDGTVTAWLAGPDPVEGLSNITSIAWAGDYNYVALKNDGTVLGFRFDNGKLTKTSANEPAIQQVRVRGQILSNVVALASRGYTPLVLKSDGSVFQLGYQGSISSLPYEYTSADPVMIEGEPLSNVVALATSVSGGAALALKKNGTVVAWGNDVTAPAGLSNVIAISTSGWTCLALKSDKTVVAWGANHHGEASVPAGLSNVVAIAAGGPFSLAITTGNIPSSVFVQSEEMEREADLIFKGQALSSERITNSAFGLSFGEAFATRFRIISVLKGNAANDEIVFQHYGKGTKGPNSWGGPPPPVSYMFETGQSYLVFAASMNKPDKYYSVLPGKTNQPYEFRQLASNPHRRGEGALRTLDARPVTGFSVKDTHWYELNLLLNDTNPTNELYAIQQMDLMSKRFGQDDEWLRTADFRREAVLNALLPIVTNANEQVALAAIGCFQVGSNSLDKISTYVDQLVQIANTASSALCRLAVITTLAGTRFEAVSNSLAQLLVNPVEDIRVQAVQLLPSYPGVFMEQALRERAEDESPNVRSVVADVIWWWKIWTASTYSGKTFSRPGRSG